MLNKCVFIGRIPNHESFPFELKNGDDPNRAVLRFAISVRRNWKPQEDQYYKDDIVNIVAFKQKAVFISEHFAKGDFITVEGSLIKEDNYEVNGEQREGRYVIQLSDVYFCGDKNQQSDQQAAAKTTAKVTPSKPLASVSLPKKGGLPTLNGAAKKPTLPPLGGSSAPKKPAFIK